MTLELVVDAPPSPVAAVLEELLDREWAAQSDRTASLQPTPTVRELVELALAGTPGGLFAASTAPAAAPRAVVEQLAGALPDTLSPWTLRAMRRATALRPALPQPALPQPPLLAAPGVAEELAAGEPSRWAMLPAPEEPAVEEAGPPQDATVIEVAPELPPATQELAPMEPQKPANADAPRRRPLTLVAGLALGAALGGAATLLSVPAVAVGALVALAGVLLGRSA